MANSAGIGGATFFSPLLLILLGLSPQVAIGTALITEVFGFTSGVVANARAHTIDWLVARRLVAVAVPAGIVGSLLRGVVPVIALKTVLGLGLLAIAVVFIRHDGHAEEDAAIARGEGGGRAFPAPRGRGPRWRDVRLSPVPSSRRPDRGLGGGACLWA